MIKTSAKSIAALALAFGCSLAANAQGSIKGYFRVSNAATEKYVEVTGPFSADPTQTKDDAQYQAGTIIYVEAEQPSNEYAYKVTSLRSQGVEVVGNYIDDYYETLTDIILPEEGFKTDEAALWSLVREGFKYGYTSIGRAAIQTMILIVATRLDDEKNIVDKGELADFAKRFNTEVAKDIDLSIRLQPVDGKSNTFVLYYETPTLDCVSEWYKDTTNTEIFQDGFEAMRSYLTGKMGVTGEGFDPSEIKEMAAWGYDLPEEYRQNPNSDGVYVVTYEEIFADPTLLFNWLKLNVIKFTDPERCPKIDLQGLYLPDFAEEMQKHRLTQQIVKYLPNLQPNQKIFLCDGKNGVTGHFDFTSQDGANSLDEYAQWVIHPVDNNTQKLMVKNNYEFEGKNYSAVYYDFPVSAGDDNTTLNTLSKEVFDPQGYAFVSLVPSETVGLQTAMVVSSSQPESQLNVADGKPIIIALTEPVTTPDNSFNVSDKTADKQYVRRKANEESSEEINTGNKNFTGILLSSMLSNFPNYPGIDITKTPVYYFRGAQEVEKLDNAEYLAFIFEDEDQNVGPNVAFYTPYAMYAEGNMVLIGSIDINVNVGETDSGHEDNDDSDVPEEEQAKVAQVFNGSDANTFKNLINFSVELTYGDDFQVSVTTPESVDVDEWLSPTLPSDLNQSYLDAFLAIQPNPYEEGEDGYESYVPGLYTQYETLFSSSTASDMTEDFVDGFYLSSHLDADQTAVLEDPTEAGGSAKGYEYDLKFDAPCSGRYMVTVQPAENAPVSFQPKTFYVKIVPNLYAKFGENETPGFNINGYQFTEEDGQYVIYLPETVTTSDGNETDFELTNLIGYTPGTYFASSVTATAGNQQVRSKVRRAAEGGVATSYFVKLPDLSSIANTSTPLSINIEKNGVDATYDFLIKTSNENLNVSTSVDVIGAESASEAIYYNLQGVRVANPVKGIYVKIQNGKATKVIL